MTALLSQLRSIAAALPPGASVSLSREWLLESLGNEPTQTHDVGTLPSLTAPAASGSLITVDDAATQIGVKPSWIYRKKRTLPFLVRVGTRALRCDSAKLEKWIARSVVR
jgi:predicted DNA-binding transcriptional regulator AlpA